MAKRVRRKMSFAAAARLRARKGEVTRTSTRSVAVRALQDLGAHWDEDSRQYYLPVYSIDDQGRRITRFLPASEWRAAVADKIGPRSVWTPDAAATAKRLLQDEAIDGSRKQRELESWLNKARLALRHAYRFRGPMAQVNPWPKVHAMIKELDKACGVPVP